MVSFCSNQDPCLAPPFIPPLFDSKELDLNFSFQRLTTRFPFLNTWLYILCLKSFRSFCAVVNIHKAITLAAVVQYVLDLSQGDETLCHSASVTYSIAIDSEFQRGSGNGFGICRGSRFFFDTVASFWMGSKV